MTDDPANRIVVGRIAALYGVRGWVKVFSHTDPRDNILRYQPWQVNVQGIWRTLQVDDGRAHGQGIVAHLSGYDDRDMVSVFLGCDVAVQAQQLARLPAGEYYWSELIGLRVITLDGIALGVVQSLLETGSNDVLVVKADRERLIPYLPGNVVREIDKDGGVMRVDWDPEF